MHIIPAGTLIGSRDGRAFIVRDLAAVAAASELPLLIDWEHRSEWGGDTRAAGWCTALHTRSDGLWGSVDWTPAGRADVVARVYRYQSPVLILDAETREVQSVVSVALTNRPALTLSEIQAFSAHRRASRETPTMTTPTTLLPAARAALKANGLTDEAIATAQAYRAQQRAEAGTVTSGLLSEARAALKASGITDEQIKVAQAYKAQQCAEVGVR